MSDISIATAVVPTTFTRFGRLPMEIQILIWRAARPEPRFIKLQSRPQAPNHNGGDHDVYSIAKPPALLHVCSDSRYEALKWYRLSFGNATFPSKIYFDMERDGLRSRCHGCAGGNQCGHLHISRTLLQDQDRVAIKRLLCEGAGIQQTRPWHALTTYYPGVVDLFLAESLPVDVDPRNNEAIDESRLRMWTEVTPLGIRPVLEDQVTEYRDHMTDMIAWGHIPDIPLLNLREVTPVEVDYGN